MYAPRLNQGDTIGIICPSHIADPERYERNAFVLSGLGYKVKFGENIYSATDGTIASAEERATDLNAMVADDDVKMILFGGGDGAVELLPLIDYENIKRHPKLFSSYSDGTSILNAIYAQTGLITYYGLGVSNFSDLRHYDFVQFEAHFTEGRRAGKFISDSIWKTLNGGACEGVIIGGYSALTALMLSNKYFKFEAEKYILILEDHEHFSVVGAVNTYLTFIEQSALMDKTAGLIFGHYAAEAPEELLSRLARFGKKNNIPVVYTDDFGHGTKHAVFPLGANARLDADKQELEFLWNN